MITNGVRPLVIHTDSDVAKSWQAMRHTTQENAFRLGVNLSYYVLGQYSDLPPRGVTIWPFPVETGGMKTVKIARVKYKGYWNPEPLAMEAFDRRLSAEDKVHIEKSTVEIDQLGGCGAGMAMMMGTSQVFLSNDQLGQLKKFVDSGGTRRAATRNSTARCFKTWRKLSGRFRPRFRRLRRSTP